MIKKYLGSKNNVNLVNEITGPYSFEDDEETPGEGTRKFNLTIKSKKIFKFVSGNGIHKTIWQGKSIWVYERSVGKPFCSKEHGYGELYKYISILVNAPETPKTLKDFIEYVIELNENQNKDTYNVYLACDGYPMWDLLKKAPKRNIESVILPLEQKRNLITDIREFISDNTAKWYSTHGIPYKKVILLHGDPGCGKTSFIGALASYFNMNIAFLQSNFKDMTDNFLTDLSHRVPSNTIMVMEDIDALFNNHRENGEGASNLTFSGVINLLDGLSCPFGQIIIMTTNHYERLDHAMVRDSRIDKIMEIKKPGRKELAIIFKSFYSESSKEQQAIFCDYLLPLKPSMASVQTIFVEYRKKGLEQLIKDIENNTIHHRKESKSNNTTYFS